MKVDWWVLQTPSGVKEVIPSDNRVTAIKRMQNDNIAEWYGKNTADYVKHNFYVDHLLKPASDKENATYLISQIQKICSWWDLSLR